MRGLLLTRFSRKLKRLEISCKIFALMDADPHGLHILSVYMHGSKTGQFAPDTVELALGDRLIWLGFKATDWQA